MAAGQGAKSSLFNFGTPSNTSQYNETNRIIWQISRQTQHYSQQFTRISVKEVHQLIPRLLSAVFGYDHTPGWRLKQCQKSRHQKEFTAGLEFLSPRGPLFQMLTKLDESGFQYQFPIKCLPYPSQLALMEGIIPPFYQEKVQLSIGSNQSVPDHICLSAFEYYFFHFVHYLQNDQIYNSPQSRIPWAPLQDCLYCALLDSYLDYYLPLSGPVPSSTGGAATGGVSPINTPPPSTSKHHSSFYGSPSLQGHTPLGLLKVNNNGVGVAYSKLATPFHQSDVGMHTEILLQILVEFWLNHTPYSVKTSYSLAPEPSFSLVHVRCLRMVLKHVLYFTNGSSHSLSSPSSFSSAVINVTETLRQSVIPVFFRKEIYQFISNAFKHWSLDDTFRFVLELWLTYIQPWRYTGTSKQASADNNELVDTVVPKKWRQYIIENLPFYTTLFLTFFGRSFQLDLTSNLGVSLLFRVAKVFAQPGLAEIMHNGEFILLNNGGGGVASDPHLSHSSIKSIFEHLEGPSFTYTPLFDIQVYEALQCLFDNIQHAKSQLSLPQGGGTPPQKNKSWLSSMWSSLVDDTSEDTPTKCVDPAKLILSLDASEKNLRNFFKLPGGEGEGNFHSSYFTSSLGFDGSPTLYPSSSSVSPSSSQLGHYVDHTHLATPPSSIEAEYEEGSCKLTPEGRKQVKNGLRVCNKLRVTALGDPLLQPIRSYENTTLVRLLYRLSTYLNDKFALQLIIIGASNNLFHKLLLQFLASPPPSRLPQQPEVPSTPTSRTSRHGPIATDTETRPRISLRIFGSYYTLAYILLSLFLIWLLSVPWLLVIAIILMILILYSFIRYCLHKS